MTDRARKQVGFCRLFMQMFSFFWFELYSGSGVKRGCAKVAKNRLGRQPKRAVGAEGGRHE